MPLVIIRGLEQRSSGMLKSYFVEHILLIILKYVFFKRNGYVVESNYFKITPLPTSVYFISQINIMHEYSKTESKYTGKIVIHSMWEQMYVTL